MDAVVWKRLYSHWHIWSLQECAGKKHERDPSTGLPEPLCDVEQGLALHYPVRTSIDGEQLAYTGGIIYIISAYVGRASVILLILRFKPSRFMTRTYIGLFVLNSIFFVLMFLINILRCVPPSLLWTTDLSVELTKDPRCKLHTKAVAKMGAPINITLNVLTFCLPLHFLMRLDIEKRERIQLSFAFLIGLMTIVGSGMQIRVAEKFEDFANMYGEWPG